MNDRQRIILGVIAVLVLVTVGVFSLMLNNASLVRVSADVETPNQCSDNLVVNIEDVIVSAKNNNQINILNGNQEQSDAKLEIMFSGFDSAPQLLDGYTIYNFNQQDEVFTSVINLGSIAPEEEIVISYRPSNIVSSNACLRVRFSPDGIAYGQDTVSRVLE